MKLLLSVLACLMILQVAYTSPYGSYQTADDDDDDDKDAALVQDMLNSVLQSESDEDVTVKKMDLDEDDEGNAGALAQGWFKRVFRKAKRFGKKAFKYARRLCAVNQQDEAELQEYEALANAMQDEYLENALHKLVKEDAAAEGFFKKLWKRGRRHLKRYGKRYARRLARRYMGCAASQVADDEGDY